MNVIFFAIVVIAFAVAGYRQIIWTPSGAKDVGPMQALIIAVIDAAGGAVTRSGRWRDRRRSPSWAGESWGRAFTASKRW